MAAPATQADNPLAPRPPRGPGAPPLGEVRDQSERALETARVEGRIGARRRRGVLPSEAEWAVSEVSPSEVRDVLEGSEPAFGVFLREATSAESAARREAYATLAAADFALLRELSGARPANEREPRPEWVARVRARIRRARRRGIGRSELVRAIVRVGPERVNQALDASEPFGLR